MLRSNFSRAILLPALIALSLLTYFGEFVRFAPTLRLTVLTLVLIVLCATSLRRMRQLNERRRMLSNTRDSLQKYRWEEVQHREW